LTLLLVIAGFSSISTAAGEMESKERLVPWDTSCRQVVKADDPDCEMSQMVLVRATGQILLRVTVRVPPQEASPAMMLQLPHGIYLPDGLKLMIDNKNWKDIVVQTCDAMACYAGLALPKKELKKLQNGKELIVGYQSLARTNVSVPVSLHGFSKSYDKIR